MSLHTLARQILSKFNYTTYSVEDLEQDCRAAELMGRHYPRYVMIDSLRLWHGGNGYGKHFVTVEYLVDGSNHRRLAADTPNAYEKLFEEERKGIVQAALRNLPPREFLVAYLLFWDSRTQNDVARILGVTQGRVSQIWKKVSRKMHRRLRRVM